jgi:hypothetical protein
MQSNSSKEALKAKAKALRTRLADMSIALTHQQALEAVAALEGEQSWGAAAAKRPQTLNRAQVETLLKRRSPRLATPEHGREPTLFAVLKTYYFQHGIETPLCEQYANEYVQTLLDDVFGTASVKEPKTAGLPVKAAQFPLVVEARQAAEAQLHFFSQMTVAKAAKDGIAPRDAEASNDTWLRTLEAALRKLDKDETDVDELVYDALGDEEASVVNNQGLAEQLETLFAWHRTYFDNDADARRAMLAELEKHLDIRLSASEGTHAGKSTLTHATETNEAHATIRPMKQLLDAGVPARQIRNQARQHLDALGSLPKGAEGRGEAIAATQRFIAELDAKVASDGGVPT